MTKRNAKYDEAAREYQDGATLRELGTRYGVAFQVMHGALKARGVQLRPNGTIPRVAKDAKNGSPA